MRRAGRAGAAGLGRGRGEEGGRVSESGSRPGGLPPSPSSGGVGLPAAGLASSSDWLPGPRKLALAIGPRSCEFRPWAGWRGRRGGARRIRPSPRPRAAESGPAPLRNVAGSARWGAGTGGRAAGRGRARFLLELLPHKGQDEPDLRRALRGVEEGAGDSVGPVWKQEALAL